MQFLISCGLSGGQISEYYWRLGEELARRGHSVVFLTWGSNRYESARDSSINVLYFPQRRPDRIADISFVRRVLVSGDIDCALGTHAAINAIAVGSFLSRTPVRVGWVHTTLKAFLLEMGGWNARTAMLLCRRRVVYAMLTDLVAVSANCKDDLVRNWRVSQDKVQVFWNAIEGPGCEFNVERSPNHIICVGRLRKVKGQDVLLKAFKNVRAVRDTKLHLVGAGEELETLVRMAHELGVSDHVYFHGALSGAEVFRQMASCAMTIVPSREESFGLVIVESFAVSTPVIASRVGGIPEIVRDGEDGILVPPEDPEALANAMILLLDNAELRRRMGDEGKRRFESNFALSSRIPAVADWLERLVVERKGARDGREVGGYSGSRG